MKAGCRFTWNGKTYQSYVSFCRDAGFNTESDKVKFTRLMHTYDNDVDRVLRHMYKEDIPIRDKLDMEFDRLLDNFDEICKKRKIKYKDMFYKFLIFYRNEKDAYREYRKEEIAIEQLRTNALKSRIGIEKEDTRKEDIELTRDDFFKQLGKYKREDTLKADKTKQPRVKHKTIKPIDPYIIPHIKYGKKELKFLTEKQLDIHNKLSINYETMLNEDVRRLLKARGIEIITEVSIEVKINQLIISCIGVNKYAKMMTLMVKLKNYSIGDALGRAFYRLNIYNACKLDTNLLESKDVALYILYLMYYNYIHKRKIYEDV